MSMSADKYGHCCLCHSNLIVPQIVGGKQIMTFTADFDQTEFVISNKTRLVVCICKPCKAGNDLSSSKIHNNIMKSVIAGWDMEMGDNKRQPLDYSNLTILFHSEGIDDYVRNDRLNKLGLLNVNNN